MGYSVDSDGFVVLDDGSVPRFAPQEEQAMYDKVLVPWAESIARHADRTGVPWQWIASQIYIESGGNPTLIAHDPPPLTSKGYGLMMLTHSSVFQGHDPQETIDDPDLNIALGTDLLAKNMRTMAQPPDIVRNASMFNCGPSNGDAKPSSKNEWGYCQNENSKHITRAVKGNNSALFLGLPGSTPGTGSGFPWVAGAIGAGGLMLAIWILKGNGAKVLGI